MSTDRFQMPNDQTLCSIFNGADRDRSGAISGPELQKALSNGTWKPFNITVVMKMITMFDKDGNGTINYNEFCQLWKYINDWLNCYHRFDQNGDGSINRVELNQALSSFGYRLTDQFYEMAMRKFGDPMKDAIVFDNFILLCITLQAATAAFSAVDVQRKGEVKVTYEQFLNMVVPII